MSTHRVAARSISPELTPNARAWEFSIDGEHVLWLRWCEMFYDVPNEDRGKVAALLPV